VTWLHIQLPPDTSTALDDAKQHSTTSATAILP
jgi:hypothetical protein